MSANGFQSEETSIQTYDIGGVIPISGFDTVPAGTNLLISGPPMVGKQRLALELLAAGPGLEHAIAITPETGYTQLKRAYESVPGSESDRFYLVDCTGATGKGSMDDTDRVKYVSSAGDLTGLGMGLVKCTREIGTKIDTGVRLSVLSLSTLAKYASAQRLFNFVHTITGRVSAAEYLGVATLDPTTLEDQQTNTLTSLFDAVVELREADDGSLEIRVLGWPEASREWHRYEPENRT